ncbi:MAG: hypothetical protein LBF26_03810 [Puniceicoccales bacterium]|nr:hypothetical protein [Puniceicoccales bacterium]
MDASSQQSGAKSQQAKRPPPLRPVDPKTYAFDVGLTRITTNKNQKKIPTLPESVEIGPSEGRIEERLQDIINLKTFESILLDALRPKVKNRQLLIPVHFRRHLRELRDYFSRARDRKGRRLSGEMEPIFDLLEAHLAEETGRNELLEQYRLMILMG